MTHVKRGFIRKLCMVMSLIIGVLFFNGCVTMPNQSHEAGTKNIQDSTGTMIVMPNAPQRVVSFGVSTDDILIPLIGAEKIVAVSDLPANWPKEIQKIKGRVTSSPESVVSFAPDLVIVPDWVSADFVEQLRVLKQTVYVYRTPNTIEETRKLIEELGKLLHEEEKSKVIIEDMNQRLSDADQLFAKQTNQTKKVALYYTALGSSGGADSTFNDLCEKANLINGGALLGIKRGERVPQEKVLQLNPDIIFIPSHAYDKDKYKAPEAEQLYQDPAFKDLKAIKERQVYVVDARWIMSYSQFMVNAVEVMAKAAYQ